MTTESKVGQDGGMKRRWYRLHWRSVAAMLTVGLALWNHQVLPVDWGGVMGLGFSTGWRHWGWPVVYRIEEQRINMGTFQSEFSSVWSWWALVLNILMAICFLASVGFVMERRARTHAFQLRLTELFAGIAAVAIALKSDRLTDFIDWIPDFLDENSNGEMDILRCLDWCSSLIVVVAIAATLSTATAITTRLTAWCFRLVSRRFRRSSAGGST